MQRYLAGRAAAMVVACLLGLVARPLGAESLATGEVVDRTALRVCADPAYLPYSNRAGEGFENRIAGLLARELGLPLTYTWYPQTVGFVRSTLRVRLCDLVMGVASANELVQNTNPYYRTTYVLAHRSADGEAMADLASPAMRSAKIGVVAGTPPANLLVERGLLGQVRSYHLRVDTRVDNPGRQMIEDLAGGAIDAALVWGPIAGYWAPRQAVPISLTRLASERPGQRLDFRISMGVRHQEPDWKRQVNDLIRTLQPEIDAVLQDYGVPLLDRQGQLIRTAASTSESETLGTAAPMPAAGPVPEPEGYRMERYRAPVPATLEGGTVLTTAALEALIDGDRPILVDVLPRPRKPDKRNPNMPWMPPPRAHIPGSVWLANTGFGELSPEFAAYFADHLEGLTGGDRQKLLVFYCNANCWMSYNAAKRAHRELGYGNVHWYPDGVDGWAAAGHDLVEAEPVPMPGFVR
jgi:quinoprotein dehydrogenase-associated probable ABC transporter substrate-binding protein/PQQ-dependent catabolism-associated CXXCW motif protein